jgi:hypothetical protein
MTYLIAAWLGCGPGPETDPVSQPDADADTDADSDADSDVDVDTDADTDTDPEPIATFLAPEFEDFSTMGWVEALDALHAKLLAEYAYGAHKSPVFADALQATYDAVRPELEVAEAEDEAPDYYALLRQYLNAVPDGRVLLDGNDRGTIDDYIGASYGLQIARLDDGRVIATKVLPDSDAALAGIKPGTEIIDWNGVPIEDALAAVDVRWGERPPATAAALRSLQERLLTRGPEDSTITLTFLNPVESLTPAELQGVEDDYAGLQLSSPWPALPPDEVVALHLLGEDTAHLRINFVAKALEGEVRDAFIDLEDRNADGIVLDLRGCDGADHESAAEMISPMYVDDTFFEYQLFVNTLTGALEHDTDNELDLIEIPTPPDTWTGAVVVLVNGGTLGACEMMAAALLEELDDVAIVGFDGTHGSPGLDGGSALMPEDLTVLWPSGVPAAADEQLLLAGDGSGDGGVAPTDVIPREEQRMVDQMAGVDVELDFAEEVLETLL